MCATVATAHDFAVGGICYKITSFSNKTVAVTYDNSLPEYYDIFKYAGNIVIPGSVTYDGDTYSVTSIDYYAFGRCTGLTSIAIPNSVTSIGHRAFEGCSGLTSIVIPNSVISIGESAFGDCSGLTSLVIPNCVTNIGQEAFDGCSGLTSIVVAEENPVYDSRNNCNAIIETGTNTLITGCATTTIPDDIVSIADGAFYGCNSFGSITIPNTVTKIGNEAFRCSIDTIYCYAITPPELYDEKVFDEYDANLNVPCSSLEAYKSDSLWGKFTNIQCFETTPPTQPQDTTIYSPTEGIGMFSVGEGKIVTFSRGNLQHTQSTNTWSFASAQWEMIGTDNVTGGSVSSDPTYGDKKYGDALADKVDLFGWSTGATNFGVSTSTDWENDYLGSFVDWGRNKIGNDAPNTWRTLSNNEWEYLLNTRTNASSLKGVAQVNGVNGLILLPDNWTSPSGVTFKSGFHNNYGVEYYAAYQTFTAAEWSKLEAAGAVFLPAAGFRYGSIVYYVQNYGYYWSATESNSNYAYFLYFYLDEAYLHYYNRINGLSVRLVKDISNTTPEPPVEPQDTTIYLPTVYETICEGETVYWWGMYCTEGGIYTYEEIVEDENYIYHYIHPLELQVLPSSIDTIVVEAYDSYEWHGKVYTESGTYIYEEHCYQEILQLTIIDTPTPPEPQDTTIYIYHPTEYGAICEGGEYYWRGVMITVAGTYTYNEIVEEENYTYLHTYTLELLPLLPDEMIELPTTEVTICENELPYVWNINWGTWEITEAGNYMYHEFLDCGEAIAIYNLNLTVLPSDTIVFVEEAYDSYEWHGRVYTESGTYIYEEHCYQEILHLTIIDTPTPPSEPQDTTIYISYEDVTICEGITFVWMGMEFTEEGIYTYEEIVVEDDYIYHYIYTLHLMVLPPTLDMYEVTAYDSYEWHGVVYTESGVYTYEEWCYQEILELTIIPSTETAVDNMQTDSDHSAQKILRDQQILILRDGKTYTIMGAEVK